MKNIKIKYKIAFSLILLIISFSVINTSIYISKEYKLGINNYKITGASIIKNIEPHVAEHIYTKDIVGLQRIVNNIKKSNHDITYAFILNPEKKVIVHSFEHDFLSDLLKINMEPIQNIELLKIGDETVYDFSCPIVGGKLGIVRIGMSRERLITDLKDSVLETVLLLFIFIVLGIVISLYISRLITNPLKELVNSVNRISDGDFKHIIKIKSKDEIGFLSMSFNSMCDNLEKLKDKLEEKIVLLNLKNNEYATLNEEYITQNEELLIAKEKAEESDRLKSAFLANMSHEIRTPMNGILGFSDLLKEPGLTGEQQKNYIHIIEKSGNRMLNIINNIVSISKIESGAMDINFSKTNINNKIEFIYNSLKLDAEKKGLNLSYVNFFNDDEAIIKTDSDKLYGILSNLVKNAIKYTDQGKIVFGYKKKDRFLEFYIKDTGIGIPKEKQQIIFERFIQADIIDKKAREGAGLGLSISKAYIEMLRGKIWLESKIGLGSTFYFTIPYVVEIIEINQKTKKQKIKI